MKCPKCGVESTGTFCPSCGASLPSSNPNQNKIKKPLYKKWWFWLIVALFALAAIGGQGGGKSSIQSVSSTDAPTATPQPTPTATPNAPSDVLRVAKLIGISPSSVTSTEIGYEALYEDVILTFNMDSDTVSKVFSGGYVFYENGETLLIVQDVIPTYEQRLTAKDKCKDLVESILKSPSSAEYPGTFFTPLEGWNVAKSDNTIIVSSYVDSQNSFGAMIRSDFIVQFNVIDDSWDIIGFIFDGETVI